MQRLAEFLKKVRVGQFLVTVFAGFILLLNTACSNETAQGARPNNLPVQMGGNNNPHTKNGDGYTNYRMSTDPKVNGKPQSNLPSDRLIASTSIKSNSSDLLYPGDRTSESSNPDIGYRTPKKLSGLPNDKQPMLERSNPDAKILERVGEAFKDASTFLEKTAEEGSARPEAKANPAIGQ
ncbi:MAG: hypothetical protein KME43_05910 [Myxacorys chilensis ATA2-1-KO14]|jgi:hypothetical protein|nr:hypothetical protein [Myxacorys chilensis ATA2-1-KO14]